MKFNTFFYCLGMGIVPSKRRWERKMRARDRSVKFQGHNAANNVDKVTARESDQYLRISYVFHLNSHTFSYILQQSTLDRKKKNFTFSRKFPFMKSKDDKNEDGSDQEREYLHTFFCIQSILRKITFVYCTPAPFSLN